MQSVTSPTKFSRSTMPTQAPVPPQKSHKIRNIVVVAAIVLVVLVVIATLAVIGTAKINITGVNVAIDYGSSTTQCLGPTQQSISITDLTNGQHGLSVKGGQSFFITIPIQVSSNAATCVIQSIAISTSGFTVTKIDPSIPDSLSSRSSVRFTITMQAPNSDFDGALNLVFTVSSS